MGMVFFFISFVTMLILFAALGILGCLGGIGGLFENNNGDGAAQGQLLPKPPTPDEL